MVIIFPIAITFPIALEFQSPISSHNERLKWLLRAGIKASYWQFERDLNFHTVSLLGLRYNFKPTGIYHYFLGIFVGPADIKLRAIQGSLSFGFGSRFSDLEFSLSPIYYFKGKDFNLDFTTSFSFPIKKWWSKKSVSLEDNNPED